MTEVQTLGIVLIGNEILTGKIKDLNSQRAIDDMRRAGASVGGVYIIPDDLDTIAQHVRMASERWTHVVTSGGVGPTHDDITVEGVARAFGVPLIRNAELAAMIEAYYTALKRPVNSWVMKMADIPEGAEILREEGLPVPILKMRNVYCLPGEPSLFQRKWRALIHRFVSVPLYAARIYTQLEEDALAEVMSRAERPGEVAVGSYPTYGPGPYRVLITVEGRDRALVDTGYQSILAAIPPEALVDHFPPADTASGERVLGG